MARSREGQIVDRGRNVWLVRVPLGQDGRGTRRYHNKTIHGTKKDADSYLRDKLRTRDLNGVEALARKVLMQELFDDVIRDYEMNGKGVPWVERKVRLYLGPTFGSMDASQVTTSAVDGYKTARRATAQNATINRELAVLKRAFNLGKQCTPPKVIQAPKFKLLKENNVRKGFFEEAEFLALRAELPDYLRPVVTFAYFTGCRRGEILALKWSQVDLEQGVIRLDPGTTKNGEGRLLPLTAELFQVLSFLAHRRRTEQPGSDLVFTYQGAAIGEFRGAWAKSCKASGLWDAEAKRPTKLFHDFRRSGVRNLVRAGVPQHVAMKISGHKTDSVFKRYDVVSEADILQAAVKLDAFHAARKGRSEAPHTVRTH